MNRLLASSVALLLVWVFSISSAWAFSKFPAPPKSQVQSVSDDTQSLGMNLRIRKFTSRLSPEQVIGFYQEMWPEDGALTPLPPWQMIGRAYKGKFYNVQVQSQGRGSWGYLSVSDLPERIEEGNLQISKKDFPMMSGSQVIDDQRHKDPHKSGRTLMISNRFSIDANSKFYLEHYQRLGWKVSGNTQGSRLRGRVLVLQKGNDLLNLTIQNLAGGTYIVANSVAGGVIDE